jgi:putative endonuclease
MNNWYVYIAKTVSGQLYTGVSNNVANRIEKHNNGKGAKFTRANGPITLVYVSGSLTKSEALKREIQIKGWTRAKKLMLITGEWK